MWFALEQRVRWRARGCSLSPSWGLTDYTGPPLLRCDSALALRSAVRLSASTQDCCERCVPPPPSQRPHAQGYMSVSEYPRAAEAWRPCKRPEEVGMGRECERNAFPINSAALASPPRAPHALPTPDPLAWGYVCSLAEMGRRARGAYGRAV